MNQFINPNRRGFELPEGCKNLIDVIQQPWLIQSSAKAELEILHEPDYPHWGGFGQIELYIAGLFTSSARGKILSIGCIEPKVVISLMHRGEGINVTLCVICADPAREQAVRGVFGEAAVLPILDSSVTSGRVPSRVLKFPLPKCAPEAAQVTTDLLRRGFSLREDARLI